MEKPASRKNLTCSDCGNEIKDEDTFCRYCGSLFQELTFCAMHGDRKAMGVCAICRKPFCSRCGSRVQGMFLCDEHWKYEVVEGMARVFGTTDNVQAQYATNCLEQAGLHPFLYSRGFNPGPDINPIVSYRVFGRHRISELKVLVPLCEVLEAERILHEIDLSKVTR